MKTNCKFLGFDFIQASSTNEIARFLIDDQNEIRSSLPIVFTPNSYILSELEKYPNLSKLKNSAYILPDGQPLVWLSRNLNKRHTGADLFNSLWKNFPDIASESLIIAPNERSLQRFKKVHPSARGIVAMQFRNEVDIEAYAKEVTKQIMQLPVKYVFVHVGFPKQEMLSLSVVEKLSKSGAIRTPLFFCLGASLEFYVGSQKRAPIWLRNIGLEWFYRWLGQPRKLFKRYFIQSPRFLFKVIQHSLSK